MISHGQLADRRGGTRPKDNALMGPRISSTLPMAALVGR